MTEVFSMRLPKAGLPGLALILLAPNLCAPAFAQGAFADEILVTSKRKAFGLAAPASVATGLGLSLLEMPAAIDIIDLADQTRRGPRSVAEATRGATGVTFTVRSGAPGVFQSRGFTENALVSLYDGVRIQSATVTARALDPFNFERIEVLRGPSSIVHGEGATAGAINFVRRKPQLGPLRAEILAEGGEEGRARAGVALSGGVTERIGATVSASYQRMTGFVDDHESQTFHAVAGIGGAIGERGGFLVEVDHFLSRVDNAYWGAPLVNGGIDRSLFARNYNQAPDNLMDDDVTQLRGVLTFRLSDALDYRGQLNSYAADRDWLNIYAFRFVPAASPLARDRVEPRNLENLGYRHRLWGTRHELRLETSLGRVDSRTLLVFDHQETDFSSPRRDGPPVGGQPRPLIDARDPQPVALLPLTGPRLRQREADVTQTGLALEQRFALGAFALVGGVRGSFIDATIARPEASPAVQPFDVRFRPLDWRAALTFTPAAGQSLYAAFTSGSEPVESLLLLPLAQADFRLTRATGLELGWKAEIGALVLTAAAYSLEKDRLPSVDPTDPNLPPQVGRQRARGVELGGAIRAGAVTASANLAYTDAVFRQFNDFGAFRDGVRPANVPEWVANAALGWDVASTFSIGGFLQHVGSRPSNNANVLALPAYTTVDLFAEWRPADALVLTLRAANVGDARYVEWATQSFGQNNLYFGSGRRIEGSAMVRF
jgi:iron complex outermembrane receptor protein